MKTNFILYTNIVLSIICICIIFIIIHNMISQSNFINCKTDWDDNYCTCRRNMDNINPNRDPFFDSDCAIDSDRLYPINFTHTL